MATNGSARPAWAAAGSFAAAYSAARGGLAGMMDDARVVSIPRDQAAVLPAAESFARPPFDTVYFDFGGVKREDTRHELVGALVWNIAERMKPQDRPTYEADPILRPHIEDPSAYVIYPFSRSFGKRVMGPAGVITVYDEGETEYEYPAFKSAVIAGNREREGAVEDLTRWHEARVKACLQWLQSYNVEIVETPLSPRQRDRELKKGRQIALTVQIKQSKRYRSTSDANGKANYSHRFETGGHYAREFELKDDGTPNKNFPRYMRKRPDDMIIVDGRPCFQKWIPPHVKGPVDRPFVPKVREVTKT